MSRINSSNPPDRIDTGRATQDHHHPGPTQSQLQYQQPHQWTKSAETLQQDFQDADHGCYEQSAKSEEGSVNLEDAESDERDTETGQEESVTQQQRREARKLRRFRSVLPLRHGNILTIPDLLAIKRDFY